MKNALPSLLQYGLRLILISVFLQLGTAVVSFGQYHFNMSPACSQGYDKILQWRLSEGLGLLQREKIADPNNLMPYWLENYADFFRLFYNEDPLDYAAYQTAIDRRLNQMEKGPRQSPFRLFSMAVLRFQKAAVEVKFGHNWDAGWDFRRSYLLLEENHTKFPSFTPDDFYRAAMQVVVGTIPDGYQWLGNLLGMKGSIKKGMQQMESFLQKKDSISLLFHDEAVFFYCYLRFYIENEKDAVFDFLENEKADFRNNHLFAYLGANLSLNNQQSDRAIEIIEHRNTSEAYMKTPVWDFELAYAKLHHLEADAAMYFERFLRNFKGRFYVKDALQKLSWYYYLQGDMERAQFYRSLILKRGSLQTEADKQALKEAKSGSWPNPLLLKSRLLSDGGYYHEAIRLLHGKNYTDFKEIAEQVEFSYRAGRLYDESGNDEEALRFYAEAIRLGEGRKEYYAARAALQSGMIFELQGKFTEAVKWYQRCLDMKDHDFKNSLDQRAKAGIGRCRGE